jgi:hypothetical protein
VRRRGVEDGTDRLRDAEIDDRVDVVGQDDVDEILPMSWTSPRTVASKSVPFPCSG